MQDPGRTKRIAALTLLACAAALAAWLFLGSDAAAPGETIPSTSVVSAAPRVAIEPDLAPLTDVPPAEARADIAPAAVAAGAVNLAPKEEPGAAGTDRVLTGRVFDPEGQPVSDAWVALIGLKAGVPTKSAGREKIRTDSRGRFRLPVPAWAWQNRVLVAARKRGSRPYSSIESIGAEFVEKELELSLGVGFSISGRLVRDGMPAAGATVGFDVAYGTGGVHGAGAECWWANGRLEEKHGSVEAGEDGSFLITGLSPAEHRIHVNEHDAPELRVSSHLFEVVAPSSRTYDLSGAVLMVTLQDQSGHVEDARIRVSTDHAHVKAESTLGPVKFEVPPETVVRVRARLTNGQQVERTVESPLSGQVMDVALIVQTVERPRLTVRVPGATAAGFKQAPLRFVSLERSDDREIVAVATEQADTFVVDVVPFEPGRYHVMLDPKDGGGTEKFLMPQREELDLPPTGDVEISFFLAMGARCRVHLNSSLQRDWSANYKLRDADGAVRKESTIWCRSFENEEGFGRSMVEFGGLPALGGSPSPKDWARTRGVLPPGTYTLEVTSPEHATWTETVEVFSRKTTKVKVELQPN